MLVEILLQVMRIGKRQKKDLKTWALIEYINQGLQ